MVIVFMKSHGKIVYYNISAICYFANCFVMKAFTNADKNNDGIVTTDELREYVITDVSKESNGLQHPTVDRDNIYQKFGFPVIK